MGNFKTITCGNGREALEILEEKHNEISLVLLDIMMPGVSGYTVLERIKNNEDFNDILVVLFTVKSFNEDIQRGKRLGADYYITKPFSGKELLTKIKEILNVKS